MAKYLKVTVNSPYIGTDRSEYIEVADDFDVDAPANWGFVDQCEQAAVDNYVDVWSKVVENEGD